MVASRDGAEVLIVLDSRHTAEAQEAGPLLRRTSKTRAAGVDGAGVGGSHEKLVFAPPVRTRLRASGETAQVVLSVGRQSSASSTPSPSESTARASGMPVVRATRAIMSIMAIGRTLVQAFGQKPIDPATELSRIGPPNRRVVAWSRRGGARAEPP